MSELKRFPYPGAIDADGHILEPPDLWEKYIDPKYRDRTIRIRKGHDGLEVLEINGAPAKYIRPGQLAQFGAIGKGEEVLTPHPGGKKIAGTQEQRIVSDVLIFVPA